MIVDDTYTLTIDEFTNEVVRLLKENDLFGNQQDNRVSAAPDMRTIRYYTTLGLLDRPVMQGRIAKYSRRHVLQMLAIKTLQLVSLPLAEIQQQLYGLSENELESIISLYLPEVTRRTKDARHESIKTVLWREIVIEPGLKILAEESWNSIDKNDLSARIQAALSSLEDGS
jgi:DNA-binding transcriptional MerR regulator